MRRPIRHDSSGPASSGAAGARPDNSIRSPLRGRLRALLLPVAERLDFVALAPVVPVREIFRRFWPYVRPYRRWLALGLLALAAIPAIQVLEIALFKRVVDDVLVPRDLDPFLWIALAYVGLNLLSAVVSACDDYLSTWITQRFLVSLRTDFFRHLLTLPMEFHDRRRLGDVLSRLSGDVSSIERFMLSGLGDALSALLRIVFFVGALVWLDWLLTLASLLVAPLFWFVTGRFSRLIKQLARERRRRHGAVNAVAEESLANSALVQAYHRQDDQVQRYRRENEAVAESELAASRVDSLLGPLVDLVELVGVLAVIALGTWALTAGRLTLGGLLAFMTYLSQLYRPVRDLSDLVTTVSSASAGAERIIEFLDERPLVADRPAAVALDGASGLIELDGVSLRYPGAARNAVEDVTLRVEPGQVLAIVGASGAGKSTLVKLLLRLIDPDAGVARLDGHALRDLRIASVRDNIGVVLQETLILDATVRDNIVFGRPEASDADVEAAARAADAHDFIEGLPHGYATPVGQRGRTLSGGQRQRIAIARALLRDAPVLLLDEPTAALDGAAARRVMEPLRRLMQGRTTILLSHDMRLVADADQIVVLSEGRVAEKGTHAELLLLDGLYAEACRTVPVSSPLGERAATPAVTGGAA